MDVEHTKALEAAATPGPWRWATSRTIMAADYSLVVDSLNDGVGAGVCEPADAEFIVHARTAVPALVAAVERVQALHTPDEISGDYGLVYCRECGDYLPCPTIRALETP